MIDRPALPHDDVLAAAIAAAAAALPFDNRPGSLQRQCTLGLFVAALSDRLMLSHPRSAVALSALVFGPSKAGATAAPSTQQPAQNA